jgi:hypothetical protein
MLHGQPSYRNILRLLEQNVKKIRKKMSCAKFGFVILYPGGPSTRDNDYGDFTILHRQQR